MNRRGFIQLLGAAGAMAATGLSLEELLAPEKTIFLPAVVPQSVLLRNAELIINPPLFVPQLWSNEILRVFKTNLVLANKVRAGTVYCAPCRTPTGSFAKFDQIAVSYAS